MQKLIRRGENGAHWERPADMPALIHQLLASRGVSSAAEAEKFLNPDVRQLHDPFLLNDMGAAAERIRLAGERGEKICIFGDYDVDGVSATAIMTLFLSERGYDCVSYIPDRHAEGYGLNENAVREIARTTALLVTVDCGVSCAAEVALAQSLGLDVIVTDHHRPGELLPDCPVVNPLLNGYPFPSLCGAGVAFKLACALGGTDAAMAYVDLAALATVADLVPLTGENRVIVSLGLERINSAPRLGLKMLIERAALSGRAISSGSIAFQLAPRINASGRLGDARRALRLLSSSDPAEAGAIADDLEAENTRRRQEETRIMREAADMMATYSLLDHKIIVLCGSGWNSGVIGLAASRLAAAYHYPVVLLAESDGMCVGSCRSIPAVDIFAALQSCADLMTRFGGHRQAAGLTMPREHLGAFIDRLDEYLRENTQPDDYLPELEYDIDCPLGSVSEEAVRLMDKLQPAGFGNPSPVFLTRVTVASARAVGKDGAHLQLQLEQDGSTLPGICFGEGGMASEAAGTTRDILYAPGLNEWRGHVSVQCEVKSFLSEPVQTVFERFLDKYPRHLRTYLTEVLYNIELNYSGKVSGAVSENQLRKWLSQSPQGTLIAAVTAQGAQSLLQFLGAYGLTDRADAMIGCWPGGQTAMNAVCLCPRGPRGAAYRRIVLWDAPPEAFCALPEGDVFCVFRRVPDSWMGELPDVDALRKIYVAVRKWGPKGVVRVSLSDIERETARLGGLKEDAGLTAGLAVLDGMGLVAVNREEASLRVLPCEKRSPQDNPLFRRLRLIYNYAVEKE